MNDSKFVDEALDQSDEKKIRKTPYWFIGLLIEVNKECLEDLIHMLHRFYTQNLTVQSFANLVIGIRKYVLIVQKAKEEKISHYETNILTDFNSIYINQIIEDLKVSDKLYKCCF